MPDPAQKDLNQAVEKKMLTMPRKNRNDSTPGLLTGEETSIL